MSILYDSDSRTIHHDQLGIGKLRCWVWRQDCEDGTVWVYGMHPQTWIRLLRGESPTVMLSYYPVWHKQGKSHWCVMLGVN
jgi:hypothetical protein